MFCGRQIVIFKKWKIKGLANLSAESAIRQVEEHFERVREATGRVAGRRDGFRV